MIEEVIVFSGENGELCQTTFSPRKLKKQGTKELAQSLDFQHEIFNVKNIPSIAGLNKARRFRGGKIEFDMDEARAIHLQRIRNKRNQKFIELGFPQRLNQELEEAILSTETKKKLQKLRDIPQNFDLKKFKTAEELKEAWPKELDT